MTDDAPQPAPGGSEAGPQAALDRVERIIDASARRLAEIERERRRIRPEDWDTLFRQIATMMQQLAAHPFIRGDLEAETRLEAMLGAPDMEAFDQATDRLAEYVEGKLAFNAALKALEEGGPMPELPRLRSAGQATGQAVRAAASHGPSGSDFDLGDGADAPQPLGRRGVLRL